MRDGAGAWTVDPVVVDAGLQGGLLWARSVLDATPIPLGFKQIRRYGAFTMPTKCHIYSDHNEKGRTLSVHMAFVDENDNLLVHVEGVTCPYNSSLNRLGGKETYAPVHGTAVSG